MASALRAPNSHTIFVHIGLTCLLIDENPNNGVMLQRELTREFPDLSFYRACPSQTAGDWLPPGPPTLCILDWGLGLGDVRNVARELEHRWPHTSLLVFSSQPNVRERFSVERQDLSLRVCGVAATIDELLRLAKIELCRAGAQAPTPAASGDKSVAEPMAPAPCQLDALNSLPFGVVLVEEATRRIRFANDVLVKWLGLPAGRELGMRLEDLHPAEVVRRIVASNRMIRRRTSPASNPALVSVPGRGGMVLDIIVGESFVRGEGLIPVFYVDATERRAVERKLRRMADAVANAASGREFFRSLVSGLARVLEVDIVAVCRAQVRPEIAMRSLATYVDGEVATDELMAVAGCPAERVLKHQLICVTRNFQKEFPAAAWMSERGVESYMGLPVMGAGGEVIGMIQIMDRKPLAKTKDLRAVLLVFAARVAAEMKRLSDEEALQERERLMREAERVSGLGSWEWFIDADRLSLSDEGLRIVGWPSLPATANREWACGVLHPEDRSRAGEVVTGAMGQDTPFEEILRVLRPNGELRWLQVRGRFIRNEGQRDSGRLAGIFLDVTERRKLSRYHEAFSRAGQLLSSAKTKLEAARILIRVAAEMFELDAAAFGLRDARSPDSFATILNVDTVDGVRNEFVPVTTCGGPTAVQRRVLDHGAQLIYRDRADGAELATVPFGVVTQRSASIMVVPIRYHQECVGIFSIHSYRSNAYCEDDLAALQALADYSAGALLRVDAADEARKSHELLRLVIDSLPAHVAYIDAKGRCLMVNRHCEQWFGRPRAEIEGRLVDAWLPHDIRQHVSAHLAQVLAGESVDDEITTDAIGGVRRHLRLNYVPHVLESGQAAGFVSLITDISSLRSVETELRESIARTQSILDSAAAVVFVKDLAGRYLLVNKLWERVMGLRREEVIGQTTAQLHPPEEACQLAADDQKVIDSRAPVEIEEVVERHGLRRTFLTVKFPLIDIGGRVHGLCGIATDITRRKAMELSMRQVTRRLKTAQSIVRFGHWEWDVGTQSLWCSDEVLRLFGLSGATGTPTWETFLALVHPEDREGMRLAYDRCLREHMPYSVLHRVLLPDQTIRYLRQHGEAIVDERGAFTSVAGVVQDVTDQQLTEQALRAAEAKFRVQYEAMPLPTFIWKQTGEDLTLIEANPAAIKFTEGMIGLFFGKTASEIFFDDSEIVEDLLRCSREKSYFTKELPNYRMRTSGRIKHLRAHVNHVAPDMVVLHVDDLSERLEAEARQRAMMQLIPDRLFRLDRNGIFLDYHASRPEEMLLDPKAVIGRNFREVLPPEPARIIESALQRAVVTGAVQLVHYTLSKGMRIHYLEGRMIHCSNSEFLAMVHDISELEYRQALAVGVH